MARLSTSKCGFSCALLVFVLVTLPATPSLAVETGAVQRGDTAAAVGGVNRQDSLNAAQEVSRAAKEKSASANGISSAIGAKLWKVWQFVVDTIQKAFAESAAFALGVLVIALMARRHVADAIQRGLTDMANTLARSIIPEMVRFRSDAMHVLETGKSPYLASEGITAPPVVEKALAVVDTLRAEAKYQEAFERLCELRDKFSLELKVLEKFLELSDDARWENSSKKLDVLEQIKRAESGFAEDPTYYVLLALAHIGARAAGLWKAMRTGALEAATKAFELEKEGRKPRRRSLIGMAHYYFSDLPNAIAITETAREEAQALQEADGGGAAQDAADDLARINNNLAFYYAERADEKDKANALDLARRAVEQDRRSQSHELPNSLDTLAYALTRFAETEDELREALTCAREATSLRPNDVEIKENHDEILRRLGSFAKQVRK